MEYLDIYDRVGDKFVHKGTMEKEEVINRGEWHKIVARTKGTVLVVGKLVEQMIF